MPPKQIFMPIDDAKRTIEIPEKPRPTAEDLETVEIIAKPKTKRKTTSKKTTSKKTPSRKKTGNFTLIITEKPQAAGKIAAALSDGKARSIKQGQVISYEFEKEGKQIVVACAVGHLFTLAQKEKGSAYPNFDIEWVPNYQAKKNDWSKKYYTALCKIAKNAKEFIVATDYDIEGEVIGWNIVRFIAGEKDAQRMKFSSLTKEEIEKAYQNPMKTINWGQAIAGETRHYLDWFYGINLSRALMQAIKTTGKFKIMSAGRVQGPALNTIVEKERIIQAFKPETYWQAFVEVEDILLKHNKDITDEKDLDKFKDLKGKTGEATTTKKDESIPPSHPFDLTSLQMDAYKFYKITPSKALQIAQQLYLAGLISYPRTSSQKIPETIEYKKILKRLPEKLTKFITRTKPIEGKKSDPAHPSIYPTGESQELSPEQKKIYDLILKRFISCFCDNATLANKKIEFTVEDLKFTEKGMEIKDKGWLNVYPTKLIEKEIKDIEGKHKVEKVTTEEKQTQPPRRYSPASIVSELEKRNLGTKATRASIIETLYNRNYIKGQQSIEATPLGISLIETLEKHSPIIIDEALTREFEKEMETIQTATKDLLQKEEKILDKAKDTLTKISNKIRKNEKKIGKELMKATEDFREQEREDSKLYPCPTCKKGTLMIKYSPRFKKSFIACSAYPDCRQTYNLPPGTIKKTEKPCRECGWPIIMRLASGKRPWFLCFNPACPGKKKDENQEDNSN